jgi:hypothetical protein
VRATAKQVTSAVTNAMENQGSVDSLQRVGRWAESILYDEVRENFEKDSCAGRWENGSLAERT